ncbi:MAG: hypothetical protein V2A54_16895 [Bacteroidota bacterium]
MIYYILATAIVSVIGFFTFTSCVQNSKGNLQENGNDSILPPDTSKRDTLLTKTELIQKLKILSVTPIKSNLNEGAMCYKTAGPPRTIDYICPVCGHKTVYADDKTHFLYRDLDRCRLRVKNIKGISATLDESQFCHKCSKEVVKDPALCLNIKIRDVSETHKTCGISDTDIDLLVEFLQGNTVHLSSTDSEIPLQNSISRIEELLGISPEEMK